MGEYEGFAGLRQGVGEEAAAEGDFEVAVDEHVRGRAGRGQPPLE